MWSLMMSTAISLVCSCEPCLHCHRHYSLSWNALGDEGATAVATALQAQPRLTELK